MDRIKGTLCPSDNYIKKILACFIVYSPYILLGRSLFMEKTNIVWTRRQLIRITKTKSPVHVSKKSFFSFVNMLPNLHLRWDWVPFLSSMLPQYMLCACVSFVCFVCFVQKHLGTFLRGQSLNTFDVTSLFRWYDLDLARLSR